MWSRIARYPRHRLSSIEFRINIGRKRRSSEEFCSNGSVPKVGNKVRGGKEKSPGFWRDCSLFRVAPSFLKQRVSLLQPVFAVTLLRVRFFKAEHACRGRSARCQPAGNLHLNFFILASRNFSSFLRRGVSFLGLKGINFLFSKTLNRQTCNI